MKILGERFGKKFGKGKKSDMDFVKTDVSKVRRLQEELVVEVRNLKAVMQEITSTLETLQTKNNAIPDPINNENDNKNTNGDVIVKNNDPSNNSSTKREGSLGTPKIVTTPYFFGDHKTFKRIQKKTKTSKESLSESESESSSTTSQDSGSENNHKSKKHKKSKRKSEQKDSKSTKRDENKNYMRDTPPFPVPQMTNPMQDFRQNVYPPSQR